MQLPCWSQFCVTLGSGWSWGSSRSAELCCVSCVGPGYGARSWGWDSSLHLVICSEVLEFHFIDGLDEKHRADKAKLWSQIPALSQLNGAGSQCHHPLDCSRPQSEELWFQPQLLCFPGTPGQGSWAGSSAWLALPCLSQQVHSARSFNPSNIPGSRKGDVAGCSVMK